MTGARQSLIGTTVMSNKLPLVELKNLFIQSPAFGRIYLADLATSLGENCLVVVLPMLVLHQTNDITLTGLAFAGEILAFGLMSPFAGSLADRMEQKLLMVGANMARIAMLGGMLLALALNAPIAVCLLLSVFLGASGAFFVPARAAFMRRLLDGEALQAAIAAEGATMFLMRIVGPGLMGALLMVAPPTVGLWVDIALYGVAIALILPRWVSGPHLASGETEVVGTWQEGWLMIGRSPRLKELFGVDLALCFIGSAGFAMCVALIETHLHLAASNNGWLFAAGGVAGAIGSQMAWLLPKSRSTMVWLMGVGALTYLLIAPFPYLGAVMALWATRGVAFGILTVIFNQTIASETPAAVMGRVNAAWGLGTCVMAFMGTASTPFLLRSLGAAGAYVLLGMLLTLVTGVLAALAVRERLSQAQAPNLA